MDFVSDSSRRLRNLPTLIIDLFDLQHALCYRRSLVFNTNGDY